MRGIGSLSGQFKVGWSKDAWQSSVVAGTGHLEERSRWGTLLAIPGRFSKYVPVF